MAKAPSRSMLRRQRIRTAMRVEVPEKGMVFVTTDYAERVPAAVTKVRIVDGKLGRPVQISVITGSVFETLGLIDGLTKDVELLSFVTGGCGKMEQMNLPVGFGGPYVRVSSMNVQ